MSAGKMVGGLTAVDHSPGVSGSNPDSVMSNAGSFLSRLGISESPKVDRAPGRPLGAFEKSEDSSASAKAVEAASNETSNTPEVSEANSVAEPEVAPTSESSKAESSQPPTKEMIQITDAKGRRSEVEIDFSNRDAVKKAYQDASNFQNGFRKMQVERDQLKSQLDKKLAEVEPIRRNFELLDSAYQKSGVEGVIDLLEGQNGGYKSWLGKQLERENYKRNASPEELRSLEQSDLAQKYQREAAERTKEFEALKKSVESDKAQAESAKLESEVTPLFEKYRFAGKLGDDADEKLFDKMLWRTAMDNLQEEYGASEQKLTPEIIEDEFRVVSASLRKRIQNQVEKNTTKVVEKRKQNAAEAVQTAVKAEYSTPTSKERAERDRYLDSGDIQGLFSGWKKFSKIGK